MTKHIHTPAAITTAARASAGDLQHLARQGVERALAARQSMSELSAEQTQQVSGAAGFVFSGGQVVPQWWIYGQPAFSQLSQSLITQGINQVSVPTTR